MKALTVITLAAALLGGAAYAQNAPATKYSNSPANIDKGSQTSHESGSQSGSSATGMRAQVTGKSHYCTQMSAGKLDCRFASMESCKTHNKSSNLKCVTNPDMMGTTGSK